MDGKAGGADHHMPTPAGDNDMPDMSDMSGARGMATMRMTFFWGKNVDILFSGWPGYGRLGMYLLALFFVFVLSAMVELLSAAPWSKKAPPSQLVSGMVHTVVHAARMGLAYLVMLAVMSFNVGVLLAAIAGHAVGFMVFRSRVFRRSSELR